MYDYEYEGDVLCALRVLKYFQMNRPERFQAVCECYEKLELNTVDELIWEVTWELFDNVISDFEPDFEVDTFIIGDALLDRLWALIQKRARKGGRFSEFACRELFRDTMNYYLTATSSTIARVDCFFHREGVQVKLWMSRDIWEPLPFANDVVTLLLYLEAECAEKSTRKTAKKSRKEAA